MKYLTFTGPEPKLKFCLNLPAGRRALRLSKIAWQVPGLSSSLPEGGFAWDNLWVTGRAPPKKPKAQKSAVPPYTVAPLAKVIFTKGMVLSTSTSWYLNCKFHPLI
jgi:hypothetical protein